MPPSRAPQTSWLLCCGALMEIRIRLTMVRPISATLPSAVTFTNGTSCTLGSRWMLARADIEGSWRFPGFLLLIEHCQGDPYAAPTCVRVQVIADCKLVSDGPNVCASGNSASTGNLPQH